MEKCKEKTKLDDGLKTYLGLLTGCTNGTFPSLRGYDSGLVLVLKKEKLGTVQSSFPFNLYFRNYYKLKCSISENLFCIACVF